MKYFFSLLLSIAILTVATAQDFKKVQNPLLLGKVQDAKKEVDKITADPKFSNKAEAWYWKSRVYAKLYTEEGKIQIGMSKEKVNEIFSAPDDIKTTTTDAGTTQMHFYNKSELVVSFDVNGKVDYISSWKSGEEIPKKANSRIFLEANEAFQKFITLDPSLTIVKANGPDGFFDMYSTSFNRGIEGFKIKDYSNAAIAFQSAVFYSDYIFQNKWASSQQPFDTTSILYCAYSFQNAKKDEDAAKYYARLADSKVTGEGLSDIYKYMVDYYTKLKNKNSFEKYLALGKEVYPNENWEDFEIEYIDQNYDLSEKAQLYNEMDASGLLTAKMYMLFGDVFISAKNNDAIDSAGVEKYTQKAIEAFKKAYENDSKNAIAAFNVGVTYYNYFNVEDEKYAANIKKLQELNANKPNAKDPKQKAAIEAEHKMKTDAIKNDNMAIERKAMEISDIASAWLLKAFESLQEKEKRSNTEKSVLNKSVDFIANICYYKMGRYRGRDAKQFELYEALYKEFDNLHGIADKGLIVSKKINLPQQSNSAYNENINVNNSNKNGVIKLTKEGGVYMVPCKANGLSLMFVFDTGAADVSISQTEASFMLKNGYLKPSDITGKQNYMTADGSISAGVTIILRELEIGGIKLNNVKASVVLQSKAPLLLGQSALSRFGKFTFDNNAGTLRLGN